MDHLMAEKRTKIIKKAKWGKSHQKIFKKDSQMLKSYFRDVIAEFSIQMHFVPFEKVLLNLSCLGSRHAQQITICYYLQYYDSWTIFSNRLIWPNKVSS